MKYDDTCWHSGGKFPKDLPANAGATHTGMYLAWALQSGLAGEIHTHEMPRNLEKLATRDLTPGAFFLWACDGKFTNEDLNEEGNVFTSSYFDLSTGSYLTDYAALLGTSLPSGLESLYYVADTWENFDKLKPKLDDRLAHWRTSV